MGSEKETKTGTGTETEASRETECLRTLHSLVSDAGGTICMMNCLAGRTPPRTETVATTITTIVQNPDEPETTITTVAIGQTKIAVGTTMTVVTSLIGTVTAVAMMMIVLAKTTDADVMMTMIVIGAGMIGTAIG